MPVPHSDSRRHCPVTATVAAAAAAPRRPQPESRTASASARSARATARARNSELQVFRARTALTRQLFIQTSNSAAERGRQTSSQLARFRPGRCDIQNPGSMRPSSISAPQSKEKEAKCFRLFIAPKYSPSNFFLFFRWAELFILIQSVVNTFLFKFHTDFGYVQHFCCKFCTSVQFLFYCSQVL